MPTSRRERSPGRHALALDTVLAGLDDEVRTNIVVLDACRDNPTAAGPQRTPAPPVRSRFGRGWRASDLGGRTLGTGTLLAFATAPGQIALDGTGTDSPPRPRFSGTWHPGLEVSPCYARTRRCGSGDP